MGKFHQFLTELSAHDMIMVGYYRSKFYFAVEFFIKVVIDLHIIAPEESYF